MFLQLLRSLDTVAIALYQLGSEWELAGQRGKTLGSVWVHSAQQAQSSQPLCRVSYWCCITQEQAVDPDAREGLLTTLASLMVEQPTVPRWLMKIDDEHGGRGHAWVDVANIKGLAAVLERLTDGGKASGGDGVEPPSLARQREAAPTVEATLRRSLARRVAIAVPALFPNWEAYAAQLLERGACRMCADGCMYRFVCLDWGLSSCPNTFVFEDEIVIEQVPSRLGYHGRWGDRG
jgi:hypothetical protein